MEVCISCLSPATTYCQADQAYLCDTCDTQIHSANKLSRRHIRTPLPSTSSDSTIPESDQELASIAGIFVKKEAEQLLRRSMASHKSVKLDESNGRSRRHEALKRFRNKRSRRTFRKTVRYQCRKQLADSRPRVKGRFVGRKSDSA